jgi:hypothetical protein
VLTRPGLVCLGLIWAGFLGGCYAYYEPPAGVAPVDRDVQLTLTDSGSVVLASQIGPSGAAISGRLLADSAENYRISIMSVRQRAGFDVGWNGERVLVPRVLVAGISERRFSGARTAAFGAATIGVLAALRVAFGGAGGATTPGTTPGGGGAK